MTAKVDFTRQAFFAIRPPAPQGCGRWVRWWQTRSHRRQAGHDNARREAAADGQRARVTNAGRCSVRQTGVKSTVRRADSDYEPTPARSEPTISQPEDVVEPVENRSSSCVTFDRLRQQVHDDSAALRIERRRSARSARMMRGRFRAHEQSLRAVLRHRIAPPASHVCGGPPRDSRATQPRASRPRRTISRKVSLGRTGSRIRNDRPRAGTPR